MTAKREMLTFFQVEFATLLNPERADAEHWVAIARRNTLDEARAYAGTLSPRAKRRIVKVIQTKQVIEDF